MDIYIYKNAVGAPLCVICVQLFLSIFKSVANECLEQKLFSFAVAHVMAAITQGCLLRNPPAPPGEQRALLLPLNLCTTSRGKGK